MAVSLQGRDCGLSLPPGCTPSVTSGADSIGHGGTSPPLLEMAGHGRHREEEQTRYRQNCTDHHEYAHQND